MQMQYDLGKRESQAAENPPVSGSAKSQRVGNGVESTSASHLLSHSYVTALTAISLGHVHHVRRRKVSPPHGSNDAFYAL